MPAARPRSEPIDGDCRHSGRTAGKKPPRDRRSQADDYRSITKLPGQGLLTLPQTVATGANFSQFEARGARCNELLERRATKKWDKLARSLRIAAKIRPCGVVALELGTAKPGGLRLAWADFRAQRHPPEVVLTGPCWRARPAWHSMKKECPSLPTSSPAAPFSPTAPWGPFSMPAASSSTVATTN